MKKFMKLSGLLALAMALATPVFTACDNDDYDTQQYKGGVNLNSFGPSPVARGGELRFLGSGMDQVVKVSIPGCDDLTEITRVSAEEIRVTVPQTAEPGHVKLHYAGGVLETKTMLTYSEPISIGSISPARVKPGTSLTIEGEYLNLINEVCFPFLEDSVNVYAADFAVHERKQIVLTVPEEAVSGIIIISDAKEVPNTIKAEAETEIVLPAVEQPLDLSGAKGGDAVTVKGTDLDLVRSVLMPDGSELEFSYSAEESAISFVLPDNATDGAIVAVPASGVKVAVANIGMVVPTELAATPAEGIRGGQEIVISGVNMEQVVSVLFPNVAESVEPAEVTATAVKVAFPEMAQSGNAVLNLKSGKTVEIALSTAKPEVTGFEPAEVAAAATVKMLGRNLDLVVSVAFPGAESFEVMPVSAAELSVEVPATAQSGAVVLTMANGESVETPALTVNAPECANIVAVETEELLAGEIMVVQLANADKLTAVEVNGQAVQYIVNGDKLYINLPTSCGKGTVVRLLSSNGEISYTYDVTPATHVENVIWTGMFDLGNWDGGGLRIDKSALEGVPAGGKLVFYLAPYADAQVQLNDANWGQQGDIIDVPADASKVEFELSADFLNAVLTTEDGWSETAIIVNGHSAVISKIAVEYEQSLETTIWSGSWSSGNWGGNQDLAWGAFDWSTVKAGAMLRLYVTPDVANPADDWWCVALRHGDGWNALPAPTPDQWGQPVSGVVELVLTREILDDLIANSGLVITGADYTLTKVTIE